MPAVDTGHARRRLTRWPRLPSTPDPDHRPAPVHARRYGCAGSRNERCLYQPKRAALLRTTCL